MQQIILLSRVYGQYQNRLFAIIQSEINSLIAELDVSIMYRIIRNNCIEIKIQGDDAEFVSNILTREYGQSLHFYDIKQNTRYIGQLVDVGKVGYGIYVDIGIIDEHRVDALIPLYTLRKQLSMNQSSVREIIDTFVLTDYLPLEIKLNEIDYVNRKIEAELSDATITRYEEWRLDDHERLIILGISRTMIESALKKTKHIDDIYEFEQLGHFEFSLLCKRSTRASGIVSAIGPYLKGVPIHLFIPREVEEKRNAAT